MNTAHVTCPTCANLTPAAPLSCESCSSPFVLLPDLDTEAEARRIRGMMRTGWLCALAGGALFGMMMWHNLSALSPFAKLFAGVVTLCWGAYGGFAWYWGTRRKPILLGPSPNYITHWGNHLAGGLMSGVVGIFYSFFGGGLYVFFKHRASLKRYERGQ